MRGCVPVPVGVPGELYLAGVQLARGYVNRSAATAARVRGRSVRCGRAHACTAPATWPAGHPSTPGIPRPPDFQVKIRGQRIELGEIESVLAGYPGVVARGCRAAKGRARHRPARRLSRQPTRRWTPATSGRSTVAVARAHGARRVRDARGAARSPRPANWIAGRLPTPEFSDNREWIAPRTDAERRVAEVFAERVGRRPSRVRR